MNSMNKTNDNKYCDKCYVIMSDAGVCCPDRSCRYFLHSTEDLNCAIVAAQSGPKTLQEIGDYYGISRMRICQIEKSILGKLKKNSPPIVAFDESSSQ
jgi:hypothetical protein